MKIVIAPDSFKDALRARTVAEYIAAGLSSKQTNLELDLCPVSDGGEGFVEAIRNASQDHAQEVNCQTVNSIGKPIQTSWMLLTKPTGATAAIIEIASASGLEELKPGERNPQETSTFGTGVMLRQALDFNPDVFILGIGGSATCDGGCGIAQALGVEFFATDQCKLVEPITGGELYRITSVEDASRDKRLRHIQIRAASDVSNPLTGPNGAATIYGPQKGASPQQVQELENGLKHVAHIWHECLGIDVEHMPGAGAAGGVGGGLVAMLGAKLVPGAELVLDTIGFDERIKDADLVITGEGRLDSQSLQGKAAMTVAKRCKAVSVPCVALVGSVGEGAEQALDHGLSAYHVIGEGLPAEESIRRTGELLEQAAVKLAQERLLD